MNDIAYGNLYIVATPIGNLDDMTFRAIKVLKEADLIAAEDTRNTIRLLNHFEISTPMTSYHEYNKYDKAMVLIGQLKEGKNIALVTDAGTPGISDPGEVIVGFAHREDIRCIPVPGPAACITALCVSGLSTRRFAFEAFLPRDKRSRADILSELRDETRTIIIYEAPHHLKETLSDLFNVLGDRKAAAARELTKIHEDINLSSLKELIEYYNDNDPRGEYVLVIEGKSLEDKKQEEKAQWEDLSVPDHVKLYEDQGFDRKEAMKKAAADRGVSKRDIYNQLMKK
ncbi:MAG: 16S rRNA (cytidine(1402)-2'-O)-methyltransferase [Lachnospiraceae bacterium]|jgi:16S rRNA (cytidine1402-2'-O)-methyltransferase|nr:16S rRNA (cytidine(1402)-2'-O)-methyltransferase [Lachnospiraceae bacterium]MEE3461582.1 16S rRNA (cytidine(1402)-2'-O)-methyltransferase [Lachnospiraceae bacterium]